MTQTNLTPIATRSNAECDDFNLSTAASGAVPAQVVTQGLPLPRPTVSGIEDSGRIRFGAACRIVRTK